MHQRWAFFARKHRVAQTRAEPRVAKWTWPAYRVALWFPAAVDLRLLDEFGGGSPKSTLRYVPVIITTLLLVRDLEPCSRFAAANAYRPSGFLVRRSLTALSIV